MNANNRPNVPLLETVARIEPARLEGTPAAINDLVAEIASASATLGKALHPRTAENLRSLVRLMNTYYSNLIEGHNTRPRDIERALAGDLDEDEARRNLQLEAAAHVRVKAELDRRAAAGDLPEPASRAFIRWLHGEFYRGAPKAMLRVKGRDRVITMKPGAFRSKAEEDNVVGRHVPPSSARVGDFMRAFEERYRFTSLGRAGQIAAIPAAHHRFNYIHPFVDGNGRVSRLMSDVMCLRAGIGAHGLWSVSRGLARGLTEGVAGRAEYRRMMDLADMPRQGDLDGRGNLSEKALIAFTVWFLKACLDQINFMSNLFDLNALAARLERWVERDEKLKPEAAKLLTEVLIRGEVERGAVTRITTLPERSARRVLNDLLKAGLLGSDTAKGAVSLRFPAAAHDALFPRLFLDGGGT